MSILRYYIFYYLKFASKAVNHILTECAIGLNKLEVMSPLLFPLFVVVLELFLQRVHMRGLILDDITFIILMLIANNMVISSDNVWIFKTV
jgi:hypothetical protein